MEFPRTAKHISHGHRLIFNEARKDFGETMKVVCYGCSEPINPEKAFFNCRECDDFFLHDTCLKLPWQIEHPMHPHALLTLLPHGPRREGPDSLCLCHVCGRNWERFTYSCDDCKFYACIFCTMVRKIKHVSHDHLLIPSEVEGNDEEVVCYGCQKPIADPQVYSCRACNFYLHIKCAALPTQVKHYLFHPEHPLTLFPRPPNSGRCNVCEESCREFTYYCELCNFSACISCVMPVSIQHMSHWHQLFPMEPHITNSEEVVCCGCKKQIADNNAYICRDCNFFLHKTCAELPNAIQHVSHKKHMLTLVPRSRLMSNVCRVCKAVWNTLTYNCEACPPFNICIPCFVLGKIKHPSHDHPIIPMEAPNHDGKEKICHGCKKPTVDDVYSCKECNFFLHKSCVDLADELQNFVHPQHPLTLVLQQSWDIKPLRCACCGESWAWFIYYCKPCKFKLCVPCAWLSSDLPREMENSFLHPHSLSLFLRPPRSYSTWTCNCCGERSEPLLYRCNCCEFYICMSCASCALLPQITMHRGHDHPLTIMRRASFQCDACGTQGEDHAYVCITCKFWVHKSCVELESTFRCVQQDQHPLTLAFSLPEEYLKFDPNCDICSKGVRPPRWVYYCGPCRFFAHIKCATSEVNSIFKLRSDQIEEAEALDSKVIRLPIPGEFRDQISYLLGTANRGEIQRAQEFTNNSHPHPLILCDDAVTKDDDLVCNGCAQPIIDSYYRCSQRCSNFFLHISCTELPDKLQHPSHPSHPLVLHLEAPAKSSGFFQCKNCNYFCNGFRYICKPCDFELDIKCALIRDAMLHESHQHPLSLVKTRGEDYCNACGLCTSLLMYECGSCGYYLDIVCAMCPRMARHKYDPHPLTLIYPPFHDHLGEFYCEECQTEINPKLWLYHCRDCNQSFHPFCLFPSNYNINFAGSYSVPKNLHQHRHFKLQKIQPRNREKFKCKICDRSFLVYLACSECNFHLCIPCVITACFNQVQWVR